MTARVLRLDVRPILASGRDPFAEIMQAAAEVPADGVMVVIAPFDPVPLREVLAASGFTSGAMALGPRDWEITFQRVAGKDCAEIPSGAAPPTRVDESRTARVRGTWTDGGKVHVDVRGLDSGSALQAILAALGAIDRGGTLVAHLDANIEALYPELAQRDCEAVFVPGERAEVRLEISTRR